MFLVFILSFTYFQVEFDSKAYDAGLKKGDQVKFKANAFHLVSVYVFILIVFDILVKMVDHLQVIVFLVQRHVIVNDKSIQHETIFPCNRNCLLERSTAEFGTQCP